MEIRYKPEVLRELITKKLKGYERFKNEHEAYHANDKEEALEKYNQWVGEFTEKYQEYSAKEGYRRLLENLNEGLCSKGKIKIPPNNEPHPASTEVEMGNGDYCLYSFERTSTLDPFSTQKDRDLVIEETIVGRWKLYLCTKDPLPSYINEGIETLKELVNCITGEEDLVVINKQQAKVLSREVDDA